MVPIARVHGDADYDAELNDVDPHAWLADVLARIADMPIAQLEQLLPWNWSSSKGLPRRLPDRKLDRRWDAATLPSTLKYVAEMLKGRRCLASERCWRRVGHLDDANAVTLPTVLARMVVMTVMMRVIRRAGIGTAPSPRSAC